ncbi:MAG TPA: hypothetical protein VIH61_02865, partial [Waddliaceae bacterium]
MGKDSKWSELSTRLEDLQTKVRILELSSRYDDGLFLCECSLRNLGIALLKRRNTLSALDARVNLRKLQELQKSYRDIFFNRKGSVTPQHQNTVMEFLLLGYALAVKADEEYGILKDFGLYTEYYLQLARKDPLLAPQDPM